MVASNEPRRLSSRSLACWVFAALAALAVLQLPTPFGGDQALFDVGGNALRSGDVMYADFWDIKQPGIFLYFAFAQLLPGPDEVAVHLVDLIGWFVLALLVRRVARHLVGESWVADVAPLLVVGTFVAGARAFDLSQIEALVGLPLLASMWFALGPPARSDHPTRALVLSGLLGGIVTVFKLVYLPIPVAFWLLAVWFNERRRWSTGAAAALGLLTVVGATAVWFAITGVMHEAWFVYVDYARTTTATAGRPYARLAGWPRYALLVFSITVPLALIGGWKALVDRRREPLLLGAAAWIVLAIPVLLVQHWWSYHMMLFFVPVGLLAVVGLDHVRTWPPKVVIGSIALLAVPSAAAVLSRTEQLVDHRLALTARDRVEYHEDLQPAYAEGYEFRRFLERDSAVAGEVYVLGNPIIQMLSGRGQAVAINGWSPEQYDIALWERLGNQLRQATPPYLVIDGFSRLYLEERNPELAVWLDQGYCFPPDAPRDLLARADTADCAAAGGG